MKIVWVTPDNVQSYMLQAACEKGVSAIQLRCKKRRWTELAAIAHEARAITNAYGVQLWINSYADLATAVKAEGLHLPEACPSPSNWKGATTRSVHSLEAARTGEKQGCEALFFGPIFHTPSKVQYGPPQGLPALKRLVQCIHVPIVAIGGVHRNNAASCIQCGASGVAMQRAIMLEVERK